MTSIREATTNEIAELFAALDTFEPVITVSYLHVACIVGDNGWGPAASPTAGPRAGLPQPDKSDANTPLLSVALVLRGPQ